MTKSNAVQLWQRIAICMLLLVLTTVASKAAGPATMHSSFRLPSVAESGQLDTIWLGGFAAAPDAAPELLGIAWAKDSASWVPMWSLHVESNAGLLPATSQVAGTQRHSLDKSVTLPWDHEIDVMIGHDGDETISVWIYDITADEHVYRGHVSAAPLPSDVHAAAGVTTKGEAFRPFASVTLWDAYIPRAAQWVLAPIIDGKPTGSLSRLSRQDEHIEGVGIRLAVPGTAPGEYRFELQQDDVNVPLLQVEQPSGDTFFPLDVTRFLAGPSRLVMQYDDPGVYSYTEAVALNVGEMFVGLEQLALVPDAANRWQLQGVARINGDGPLPALDLLLYYDIRIPGLRAPLHQNWQTVAGTGTVPLAKSPGTEQLVSFAVDVGSLSVHPQEDEIFVSVVPSNDGKLRLTHTGGGRFVAGTRTPVFPTVEGYHVVRADLHAHTTLSDGQLLPSDRAWESRVYGYDVVSLTDHGTHQAYDFAVDLANRIGLVLIRGLETGRADGEHFVALNVDPDYKPRNSHKWALQPGQSTVFYQDQVRSIIDHGGMIIYAHPGGNWLPEPLYDHPEVDVGWTDAIEWMLEEGYLHGIDVRGHYAARRRDAPFRWALQHGLTMVDVSDIHEPRDFNAADKAPLSLLFVEEASVAGAMDALWNGRSVIWRNGQLRGPERWLVPLIETMLEFSTVIVDEETCLQLKSTGGLPLNGVLVNDETGSRRNVALAPYDTICVDGLAEGNKVRATWLNVFSEPGKALVTTHVILD